MKAIRAIGRSIAAIWRWLGGPWRSLKAFAVALVNMDRRQMRALFSIAMLGGIMALSFQNGFLILMVREMLGDALPGSLFGQMALNQQAWNNGIIMVFCVSLAMIVWGADYFTAKYRGAEISAGTGGELKDQNEPPAHEAAKPVDPASPPQPDEEMTA